MINSEKVSSRNNNFTIHGDRNFFSFSFAVDSSPGVEEEHSMSSVDGEDDEDEDDISSSTSPLISEPNLLVNQDLVFFSSIGFLKRGGRERERLLERLVEKERGYIIVKKDRYRQTKPLNVNLIFLKPSLILLTC